ncbi:MAG: hypothetical protein NC120_12485, partial [Ruminococcus sp.]|nr:hypothetical protein [Ruminococcus sp.]
SGKPISERNVRDLARKKNVTVSLEYSGYSVSVNSDNIDPKRQGDLDFSSKKKFMTKSEEKRFSGAAEVRQLVFKSGSLNGISTVTLDVTMRGNSKGKTAKLLLRTADGKYILVAEAKVGSDRKVSFDITKPGDYIIYTGTVDIKYTTAE